MGNCVCHERTFIVEFSFKLSEDKNNLIGSLSLVKLTLIMNDFYFQLYLEFMPMNQGPTLFGVKCSVSFRQLRVDIHQKFFISALDRQGIHLLLDCRLLEYKSIVYTLVFCTIQCLLYPVAHLTCLKSKTGICDDVMSD